MSSQRRDSGPLRAKTGTHARRPAASATATRTAGIAPSGATRAGHAQASGGVRAGNATAHSSAALHVIGTGKNVPAARGSTQAGSDRRGTPGGKGKGKYAGKGLGLRAKFMLVLSGVTAIAMILLGVIMTIKANKYLGNQKMHDGIEVAKLTAEIANNVAQEITDLERVEPESAKDYNRFRAMILASVENARNWGSGLGNAPSDIMAVKFNCPDKFQLLSGSGFGSEEQSGMDKGDTFRSLFLTKSGQTLDLPDSISVFSGIRKADGIETPTYRYKVQLDRRLFGGHDPSASDWTQTAYVNVDVNASSVNNAQSNLLTAIFMGVVLSIAIVIGVANWLAGNITHPVELLVRDMKAVAQGHLDHETKPHSTDEIGVLANEFNRMTHNLKAAQSALVEQEKAEYELSLAREVQRQLLPANSPEIPGYQCASYYLGAKAVSGDYFDFIDLGDGVWGFIIADVSGKGIPGSMVMAVTRTIVRLTAMQNGNRAHETLKTTNRLIAKQIKRGMFVTSFYAVLDTRTGQLTYACAGHNPMIIYRGAKRSYELAAGKGIALGFNEGPIFDKTIELHQTVLNRGDGIVLYTDGFPEAMNSKNEEFGDDEFYALVPKYAQGDVHILINGLVGEIAKHRGDAEQSDDLTLLTVRRI